MVLGLGGVSACCTLATTTDGAATTARKLLNCDCQMQFPNRKFGTSMTVHVPKPHESELNS
eukprot:6489544-Amphidinium_carterae.1